MIRREYPEQIQAKEIPEKEYSLRRPVPNKYIIEIDNGYKMLKCPKCECRIISIHFSYAVGNCGYSFCPYCGEDLRKPEQMRLEVEP